MSGTLDWFPFSPADYMADTRRFTTVEHGAYMLLLMEQWLHGDLPDDDDELARIAGMRRDHWKRIAARLRDKFPPVGDTGWLRNGRLHREREKAETRVANASGAANKRWRGDRDSQRDGNVPVKESPRARLEEDKSLKNNDSGDAGALPGHPYNYNKNYSPSESAPGGLDLFGEAGAVERKRGRRAKPAAAVSADVEADIKPTPRAVLFAEGAPKLAAMRRCAAGDVEGLVGKWAKGHDPLAVLKAIQNAHAKWMTLPPGTKFSAVGYVETALARGAGTVAALPGTGAAPPPRSRGDGPVPDTVNGWRVEAVVERCCDLLGAQADSDALWGQDFVRIVAAALARHGDPDLVIYPAMRKAAKHGVSRIKGAGWFVAAILGDGKEAA